MERGKVHSFNTARCYLQLFIAYFTLCIRLKLFQAKPFAFCYFCELFFSSRFSAFMFITSMLCVHNLRNVTNLENTNSILEWIAHGKFDEIVWHFLQDSSIFYCSLVRLMAADFFIILFLLVFFRESNKALERYLFQYRQNTSTNLMWCFCSTLRSIHCTCA